MVPKDVQPEWTIRSTRNQKSIIAKYLREIIALKSFIHFCGDFSWPWSGRLNVCHFKDGRFEPRFIKDKKELVVFWLVTVLDLLKAYMVQYGSRF